MKNMMWYCSNCQKVNKLDSEPGNERQFFQRYETQTICTLSDELYRLLKKVNTLHTKFEFTTETPDKNGNIAFLDMIINVKTSKQKNGEWYRKPDATGVVLNFRSCAPIKHK